MHATTGNGARRRNGLAVGGAEHDLVGMRHPVDTFEQGAGVGTGNGCGAEMHGNLGLDARPVIRRKAVPRGCASHFDDTVVKHGSPHRCADALGAPHAGIGVADFATYDASATADAFGFACGGETVGCGKFGGGGGCRCRAGRRHIGADSRAVVTSVEHTALRLRCELLLMVTYDAVVTQFPVTFLTLDRGRTGRWRLGSIGSGSG